MCKKCRCDLPIEERIELGLKEMEESLHRLDKASKEADDFLNKSIKQALGHHCN